MDSLVNASSFSLEPITQNQQPTPFPDANQQMGSDSGGRRVPKLIGPQPEAEQLPCPRCKSSNTKFCYYNNYNLSQPRHFCKSCRRYWTRGGALRNIPHGGGTRKAASSNKRPRVTTPTPSSTPTSVRNSDALVSCSNGDDGAGESQTRNPVASIPDPGLGSEPLAGASVNLNDSATFKSGSLNSWWSGQMGSGGSFVHFYGYGLGHESSNGLGFGDLDPAGVESGGAVQMAEESRSCDTWQIGGGAEGILDEDCYYSLPEVAASTPANALK